jgi:protein phosphatase PTC7
MRASTRDRGIKHSPTFLVGNEKQKKLLKDFKKREQTFSEDYQKNKPLCFNARAYQKTHPQKAERGCTDADATLVSPMLLGVADGVSQIEDFGIDPSELPNELLRCCEELSRTQLYPRCAATAGKDGPGSEYHGPIPLMRQAFEATESLGSTTVLLTLMDNNTKIHGKLHPMIAVMAVGDCELILLRRKAPEGPLQMVFHTEMQRIDGHAQTPLQVARVDDRVYSGFDEQMTIDVIERGSAVHCMCIFEGDVMVQGSDGVFDNLFLEEIENICNEYMPPPSRGGRFEPTQPAVFETIARRIVAESHSKSFPGPHGGLLDSPIGVGGKIDDTSCVVGEVVEWTRERRTIWERTHEQRPQNNCFFCGFDGERLQCVEQIQCDYDEEDSDNEVSEVCAVTSGRGDPAAPSCWPQSRATFPYKGQFW